jgi:ketosteroid isomerase-like protein
MPFHSGFDDLQDQSTLAQLQSIFDSVWPAVREADASISRADIARRILAAHRAGNTPQQIKEAVLSSITFAKAGPAPTSENGEAMTDTARDDRRSVERALRAYADAFGRGDSAAAAQFCITPFLWVTADRVALAASPEEVERRYAEVLDALRARGFSRTEFIELHIGMLGSALALASGRAVRYAADGAELEQIGATYLLRKIEAQWRIGVLIAHPPEAVVQGLGRR